MLKSVPKVLPVPIVNIKLPMIALTDELSSFKKLPVAFAELIFATVEDVDVPVSEFLDVTTAVAAAESNVALLTVIVKSREIDVPAVDKAETLSKLMALITTPLTLVEATVPVTFVVSHVNASCDTPTRTEHAAVPLVSINAGIDKPAPSKFAASARVAIPAVLNFAPVTLTVPVKTAFVFCAKRMNKRWVPIVVEVTAVTGKA